MSTLGARAAVVHERQRENIADLMGDLINGLLAEPTTTDVILNPPLPGEAHGRLWVTRLGRDREPVGTMSPEQAMRLIGAVAASLAAFRRSSPHRSSPVVVPRPPSFRSPGMSRTAR